MRSGIKRNLYGTGEKSYLLLEEVHEIKIPTSMSVSSIFCLFVCVFVRATGHNSRAIFNKLYARVATSPGKEEQVKFWNSSAP